MYKDLEAGRILAVPETEKYRVAGTQREKMTTLTPAPTANILYLLCYTGIVLRDLHVLFVHYNSVGRYS